MRVVPAPALPRIARKEAIYLLSTHSRHTMHRWGKRTNDVLGIAGKNIIVF